ncbi:MAG TPA: hypothetical protein PLA71_00005 [Saccharofermentans sp.]|nr:hypothetical protein [Saccharofermentans sp.]
MSNVFIPWSGGFDSTSLILHYLKNTDYVVHPIYVELKNNPLQYAAEQIARQALRAKIHEKYGFEKLGYERRVGSLDLEYGNVGHVLTQPQMWCYMVNYYVMNEMYRNKSQFFEVAFGYVKDDCFWHFKDAFLDMWKNLTRFAETSVRKKEVEITFPFEWNTKEEIVDLYWNDDFAHSLFKHLSTSEVGTHWLVEHQKDEKNKHLYSLYRRMKKNSKRPIPADCCVVSDKQVEATIKEATVDLKKLVEHIESTEDASVGIDTSTDWIEEIKIK